ncbi:nitrogen fixation iron-sulfur cluster assembly cysteine desulfurase NifS [Geotalea daltonii FRC-32]|uniref:cysteine desulfurase n=2 Tax=Geotalea TaxID=2910589 RepID=B9M097_GEODF|nr:nitrogen fixation iron-sulfur cluster assembly cysteine desulfurase NifS [Geotalea daltonii FRC-32]
MIMSARIYFDNSATTPLDPQVRQAMSPFLDAVYGNPSSMHREGLEARQAVEYARSQVAALLGANGDEIIFTASGTEASNLALWGTVQAQLGCHVITTTIEHPAVLQTCRALASAGIEVTRLPVGGDGIVDPAALAVALRPTTRLVSVMAANNVVGTLQPIAELALITRNHGAVFHCDAVQAVGKIPLDMGRLPVDLLSLSAHKFHGPKGVGALYIRKGVRLSPLIHGGGQEKGLRSATENVAGIVGLGAAAAIAANGMSAETARLVCLRDRLLDRLLQRIPQAYLIGHRYRRLPGHLCLGIDGREGETIKLLMALDDAGIAVSTGSACSASHGGEPSYILSAMGYDPLRARGSLRITLGRFNTEKEVDHFIDVIAAQIN